MTNQQQPDNFFREKFANYQRPAPVGAWDKIESSLEKKTAHRFGWWKIAASFLLVAGAMYTLWFFTSTTEKQPLAEKGNKIETLPGKSTEPAVDHRKESQDQIASQENKPGIAALQKKSPAKKSKRTNDATPSVSVETVSELKEKNQADVLTETVIAPIVTQNESPQKQATITMTISIDETNKYLDKKALAQATSEEKKSSTFKKLLKKANDLKSNQDPFGDLREKKNEILALNFKNEKRGQNK